MLRWVLDNGPAAIACEVDAMTRRAQHLVGAIRRRSSWSHAALPTGAYRDDAAKSALTLVAATDVRRVTGYQDVVDEAPLDLVYVADHTRMRMVPAGQRESYSSAAAGAIWRSRFFSRPKALKVLRSYLHSLPSQSQRRWLAGPAANNRFGSWHSALTVTMSS
jgi:hypothetical protein